MTVSKSQQAAVNRYIKKSYDRLNVTLPKGQLETIKAHAAGMGEMTNAFVRRALAETMARDKQKGAQPDSPK